LQKEKERLAAELKKRNADLAKRKDELAKLDADLVKRDAELAKRNADLKKSRGDLGRLQLVASAAEKQIATMKRESAKIDAVRYAKGAADVTTQQARVLTQVQKVLELFPKAHFEIVGHTCDLGSSEANRRQNRRVVVEILD